MLSQNLLSEIKRKSGELNALKPLKPEHQAKLDKKFRLEFNFNSNQLEGNTLTYGETELLLIFDQTEGTHDYREYQEMQAHDVALKMIQEEALDKERPLTEQFIRSLNEKLLVKPFWKDAITPDGQATRKEIIPGAYKKTPNSVRLANGEIFNYTAPADVQNEMAALVAWYNKDSESEDPILLASILHYRFVRIHPFDDGNGRTARLLMNYVLSKNNLPLVIIKSAEKKEYLSALNRADTGDLNAFVEYIGNQLMWSLNICIKAAKGENIDEDDDLDKELELLKQDLKQFPDEYDKKRSYQEINLLMDESILPLMASLSEKVKKIADLFVEVNSYISLIIFEDNITSTTELRYEERDFFIWEGKFSKGDFKKKITQISIELSFTALRKSVSRKDIKYSLKVKLEDFHYIIYDNFDNKDLVKLPYGKFLSKSQINFIVKFIMGKIIEKIKSATNLNN